MDEKSSGRLIGHLDHFDRERKIAGLQVVAKSVGDVWIPLSREQAREDFPDRGKLFWWKAPPEVGNSSLWEVLIEPSASYDGISRLDKYSVSADARPVFQFIDARHLSEVEIRDALSSSSGFDIGYDLSSFAVFVLKGSWIGPISLVKVKDDSACYRLTESTKLESVPYIAGNSDDLCQITIEGREHLIARPGYDLEPTGTRNWQSDDELIRSSVKRLRKIDQHAFEAMDITFAMIDKYATAVEKSKIVGQQRSIDEARLTRLRELKGEILGAKSYLEEAVEFLLIQPNVEQRLSSETEELKEQLKSQAEKEVREEFLARKAEIKNQDKEITSRGRQLKELDAKIAKRKDEVLNQLGSLDASIEKKIDAIAKRPDDFLATQIVSQWALKTAVSLEETKAPVGRHEPWGEIREGEVIEGVDALIGRLSHSLSAKGISETPSISAIASMLSGFCPILTGDCATEVALLIGDTLCGGRTVVAPLSPLNSSPGEIFSSWEGTESLVAWLDSNPDKLAMLLIEGINRAPCEYSALHLLKGSQSRSRGALARSTCLPFSGGVWPSNLLLISTADQGNHRFAISREVFLNGIAVPVLTSDRKAVTALQSVRARGSVRTQLWAQWQESLSASASTNVVSTSLRELPGVSNWFDSYRLLRSAVDFLSPGSAEDVLRISHSALLPLMPSSEAASSNIEEALRDIGRLPAEVIVELDQSLSSLISDPKS